MISPQTTLGPLDHMDPASQSRFFLLVMVEFIMLMPSSLTSQSLAVLASSSSMSMMSSILCMRSLAASVLSIRPLYSSSVSLPAPCSHLASSSAAS